jgi:hypothetical protein
LCVLGVLLFGSKYGKRSQRLPGANIEGRVSTGFARAPPIMGPTIELPFVSALQLVSMFAKRRATYPMHQTNGITAYARAATHVSLGLTP